MVDWRGWWARLVEFDGKGLLVDCVVGDFGVHRSGYVFDRRVFRVYLIVVFAALAFIMFSSGVGSREVFLTCDGVLGEFCENPLFGDRSLVGGPCGGAVGLARLPPGFSCGAAPSEEFGRLVRWFVLLVVVGLLLSLLLNHVLWNRGRLLLEVE